jgi:hypothetical protein
MISITSIWLILFLSYLLVTPTYILVCLAELASITISTNALGSIGSFHAFSRIFAKVLQALVHFDITMTTVVY